MSLSRSIILQLIPASGEQFCTDFRRRPADLQRSCVPQRDGLTLSMLRTRMPIPCRWMLRCQLGWWSMRQMRLNMRSLVATAARSPYTALSKAAVAACLWPMMVLASRKARNGRHAESLERLSFAPFARTPRPVSRSNRGWGLEPECRLYFRGLPRLRKNRDIVRREPRLFGILEALESRGIPWSGAGISRAEPFRTNAPEMLGKPPCSLRVTQPNAELKRVKRIIFPTFCSEVPVRQQPGVPSNSWSSIEIAPRGEDVLLLGRTEWVSRMLSNIRLNGLLPIEWVRTG